MPRGGTHVVINGFNRSSPSDMLRTYFKIAIRTLQRQKLYATINIGGLAIGIAAAFVLGLYVRQELTYDDHFEDSERIYRIATDFFAMGGFANSQEQLVDVLRAESPIVETATRFRGGGPLAVAVGSQIFEETEYLNVDTAFFRVFSYAFVAGAPEGVLQAPDEVVISEALAAKYFGTRGSASQTIGEVIRVGKEEVPYRVSAVVRMPAGKSHLAADMWLPLEHTNDATRWTNVEYYNYVKLVESATSADLERTLDEVLRGHAFPASGFAGTFEEWTAAPQSVQFFVQPLADIYLHSDYNFELSPGGNPTQVYSLALIGALVLLIAGMNYVNLTTAYSTVRAKEVGVKKSLGAARAALVRQFLAETVAFSLFAMILAIGFAQVMLAVFSFITGDTLVGSLFDNAGHLVALVVVSVAVGLTAGVYPALYLANFRPVQILKGNWTLGGNSRLRGGLVVVQFAIAILLVISSLVVFRQLDFLQTSDKGFDHEGVLIVDNVNSLGSQAEAFRQQIEQMPQVASTSFSMRVPLGRGVRMYTFQTPQMDESITIQNFVGDDKYIPTLGLRLIAGRNFSGDLASDSSAAIINEAAARALQLGDEPLGKEINEGQYVVGVISDFNFQSLRNRIEPIVLTYAETGGQLAIKLGGNGVSGFIEQLPETWRRFNQEDPLR